MSKIIERIVKSIGSPSENDLWLKKDGQELSLNAYDNGEWKLVAGGGGGGGDATDAIKYTEQTLTEDQQMQARKNQGLYYKEGETVSSLIWDGVPSEDDIHVYIEDYGIDYYLHKASSVAIPPSQMLGATVSWMAGTVEQSATITQGMVDTYESQAVSGAYNDGGAGFTVVLADSIEDPTLGVTVTRGVWFIGGGVGNSSFFTKSIVLAEPYTEETIHQIPSEYIPDLTIYAEVAAGSSQPVIKSGTDKFSDFVNALKGGPGSPKFVINDTRHNIFYINQTFSLVVEYGEASNTVSISTLLQDGNNTQAGITANFDSEDNYTNIMAYIEGNE